MRGSAWVKSRAVPETRRRPKPRRDFPDFQHVLFAYVCATPFSGLPAGRIYVSTTLSTTVTATATATATNQWLDRDNSLSQANLVLLWYLRFTLFV